MDRPLILFLDDDDGMRDAISLALEAEFNVISVATAQQALDKISTPPNEIEVAVVDMRLYDDWDGGLEVIQEVAQLDVYPEMIVLTGYPSSENTVKCMEAGAFSYVEKSADVDEDGKPVYLSLLTATIHRGHQHYRAKRRREEEMERYVSGFISCLANVIDSHEPYTAGHSKRVAETSRLIARAYGFTERECEDLRMAGYVHDIGKVGIDVSVLTRSGPLTNMEFVMIREHPVEGKRILESADALQHLIPAVLDHHEQYNGKGYPNQKQGDEISKEGRIMAAADTLDAIVSTRPYQPTMPLNKARDVIMGRDEQRSRPGQFDQKVVEAFDSVFDAICEQVYVGYDRD